MNLYELAGYAQDKLDAFFESFDMSAMPASAVILFNDLRDQYTDMVLRLAAGSPNPRVVVDRLVEYLWEADAELRAEGVFAYNLQTLFTTIADRLLAEAPDDLSDELVEYEPELPSLN